MKEIQLFLVPAPGKKPEFLATITRVEDGSSGGAANAGIWDHILPTQIVLESYTRDGWAWKPNPSVFKSFIVQSVDTRNKLQGFLKYLKERQKACYGKFKKGTSQQSSSVGIISYIQPANKLPNEKSCELRIALDINQIPNCTLVTPGSAPTATAATANTTGATKPNPQQQPPPTKKRKAGIGFLGNLVGAQKRTNQHVLIASSKTVPKAAAAAAAAATTTTLLGTTSAPNGGANVSLHPSADSSSTSENNGTRTAQDVMADFRTHCQNIMLDFDISDEPMIKVKVSLGEQTKNMISSEEKLKVTMDILKYIVYEQAEEVNEEWIAHKEESEFLDEVEIAVYKEGQAPLEVIEELNKGEMPDEVRGQQQAMAQQQSKSQQIREDKKTQQLQQEALKSRAANDNIEVLNQKKRDRRTVEEIQRDMLR